MKTPSDRIRRLVRHARAIPGVIATSAAVCLLLAGACAVKPAHLAKSASSGSRGSGGAPSAVDPRGGLPAEADARGAIRERPAFHPDSIEGRQAVQALSVNTSLGDWRPVGPSNFGGKVYSVAVDPLNSDNVYAAYEVGGLWGTRNGGQTWLAMFNGFQDMAFSSVRTHPTVSGLVAAGLIANGGGYSHSFNQHVGVVLSTDGGDTWRNIGPGSDPTASVWEIGFGDTTGQTIFAPTDRGLYKTTNQGQSWTKILAYSGTNFFEDRPSFAVDPANSSILLLAQRTIGVMRSTDGGNSWTRVDTWVNPGTAAENPTILTWSTANPDFVHAEAYVNGGNASLATYASADAGLTWAPTAVTTDFQQGMYDMAVAVDPFNASHVIIHNTHLQYSNDGLATLNEGTAPGPDCLSVTFDPSASGVVYDGGDEGLFRSADGATPGCGSTSACARPSPWEGRICRLGPTGISIQTLPITPDKRIILVSAGIKQVTAMSTIVPT